ncbi:hypothetical protein BWD42_07565 [Sphingobacterium sp. CZ-UAM]|uniref:BT_3987 domain-containing protein n=1 Tax=Sphingobacterium sp. CZ-UAM TaxID=1933868 RepID=UPI00098629D4|nr:DUF1735 domain-containing protein [Sphingobacterium sp. CZ-UAM]OOG19750.1 hypothetical protein BWD42_07565 [Sphingobacterium sp. CZ-UAM]
MKLHFKALYMPILLYSTGLFFLTACKKEKTNELEELTVYNSPGSVAYNIQLGRSITVFRNTILSEPKAVAFPVMLTRSYSRDIQVTASIDTTWIKEYDKMLNLSMPSPALPAEAFKLINDKVTIKAGETSSTDSLTVKFVKSIGLKPGDNTYVVPVVLQTADNNIPVSARRQVMYVTVPIISVATSISINNSNITDITLENINGVTTGTDLIQIQSTLNTKIKTPTTVTVKDDNALIEAYNKKNGTSYQAFPLGSYQFVNATATIQAGQNSADISLRLTNLKAFDPAKEYLLPISAVEDNNMQNPFVDPSRQTVYIHVKIKINQIDPANSGLMGNIVDRAGWKVTVSGQYNDMGANNVIDGNNYTAWDSNGKLPAWLILDMGESTTLKGFSIIPNYVYKSDDFTNIEVLSSDNGLTWKIIGWYVGTKTSATSSAEQPDIKTIKFTETQTARYFKFNITKSSDGSYTGMSELNAIE